MRLSERPQCLKDIENWKLPSFLQESTDLSIGRARQCNFARHHCISMNELLNDLPALIENLHERCIVWDRGND
ncbi:hypothetical protein HMPREF2947_07540 [Pseudomonas aeruginosa]|nr:hypothetical protein HMPREF2947_07540 [Pseudomonas aeruginosa]